MSLSDPATLANIVNQRSPYVQIYYLQLMPDASLCIWFALRFTIAFTPVVYHTWFTRPIADIPSEMEANRGEGEPPCK